MKKDHLTYAFVLNIIFLTLHEIDATYWKEWEFFGIYSDETGLNVFLLAHIPIYAVLFWALLNLHKRTGKIISLVVSSFLTVHFFLHRFLSPGEQYFDSTLSEVIIFVIMLISVIQLFLTIKSLRNAPQKTGG